MRVFARRRLYRDLSEEIEQHIAERVNVLVESESPRTGTVHIARREFGKQTLSSGQGYEIRRRRILDSHLFDIRYAICQLIRQPSPQ